MLEIPELLTEYDRARAYTDELWRDLTTEELHWRPQQDFSPSVGTSDTRPTSRTS